MLNLLPKGIIINNIVDTLKKDPENGVVKLLETAKSYTKTQNESAMLSAVINYYQTSQSAKMQIRNLVYNTTYQTLYAFAQAISESLKPPITIHFLKLTSLQVASKIPANQRIFPMIELENLGEQSQNILGQLKKDGQVFFVTLLTNADNFDIVTSDDVITTLIRCGVRGIFYQLPIGDQALEHDLVTKINQIRTSRPILAFYMKKDATGYGTSLNYTISEIIGGQEYQIKLKLD